MTRRKETPDKYCKHCGKRMVRRVYQTHLESLTAFAVRQFCDRLCHAKWQAKDGVTRSALHKRARNLCGSRCESCGSARRELCVHHLDGNPANNRKENIQTLCHSCHMGWHWRNGMRGGRPMRFCSVCGTPARRLGMCIKHYQRFRTHGDPRLTNRWIGRELVLVREPLEALAD